MANPKCALQQPYSAGKVSQQTGSNCAVNSVSISNTDVKIKLVGTGYREATWSIERGVVQLLQVSNDVTSNIPFTCGCIEALNVDKGSVTIKGGDTIEAGRWLKDTLASVKVEAPIQSPIFIAAMRLPDVASEVASTLKQFPASFELTDNGFVVYTWQEVKLKEVFSAIHAAVAEGQIEVDFADSSGSKQSFSSRLSYWEKQYAHSVCIAVDKKDCHVYHVAGLVERVKLLYNDLLLYSCHKIERRVTPALAQLLQTYGSGGLFDSVDGCLMIISADNSKMVVYCTQRVKTQVEQICDSINSVIQTQSCTVPRDTDTDMNAMTAILESIEIKHRVVIHSDQSDNRNHNVSVSKDTFVSRSYYVDISDKTQLRLVDADITDLCVDAIVSTIDEHGTPNTTLAQHIVTRGIRDMLKQKVTCKLKSGAVVMTDGGQLPCKSVIHVQYPPTQLTTTYVDHLSYEESEALKRCVGNILATCKKSKNKFNTVAIPVIGSYSNKQKLANCMWHMARALRECVEVIKSLSVRHIVLVAYGRDNFKLFRDKLHLEFANDPKTKFNIVHIDKCVKINGCCVNLMTGDLLNMKVDAIVVAIPRNKDLTRGGLAFTIHQKDPNIQKQLRDNKWPDEATGGGVIVCQSNRLASRFVFFIHLLSYTDVNAQQHFQDTIDACLQQAAKQDIQSIAFPVLGTGVLDYPDHFVSSCMTTLIKNFCQGQPGKCTDIHVVQYHDTEGTAFVDKFENLARKFGSKRLLNEKEGQNTHGRQALEATTDMLQFKIIGFDVESVTSARQSVWQVFTGCHDNTQKSGAVASKAGHCEDMQRFESVANGAANGRDMLMVFASESSTRAVWVYEDTDEQWTKFIPGLQATLEDDYSNGCEHSLWGGIGPCLRLHTVTFKTQPMTYMVTFGDTIELSTKVERRVMHARCVDETWMYVTDDEDEPNTRVGERQVNTAAERSTAPVPHDTHVRSMSGSPGRRTSSTSDDNDSSHVEYNHTTTVLHKITVRPSAYRKKNNDQQQVGDTAAIHQPTHRRQSPTHDTDTMNTEPTYVNTAQYSNKPSAGRKNRSNPPDQSNESMEITPSSLSRQSSEDSQTNVKANKNVVMPTKYTWDSNIPSYWAPMDGSSVKTLVLHPTDSEYQLVADTFLASLGNTLATVTQIERIQNPILHKQYVNNKEIMDKTNPPAIKNEQHLWHGITVTMTQHGPWPVTAINARGFNRSYTARSSGEAIYGNGTYFAVEARKSLRYCNPDVNGHRHMYWCRVLTGEYTRGYSDIIVAPVKIKGTYDLYNSVVDIVESPTVFVIFEDAHAYPEYLITFK